MTKTVEQVITETSSLEQSSLLDEIMSHTRIASDSEGYDVAKQGVAAFISNILSTDNQEEPINKLLIDRMIAEIDRKLSIQVDEILHNSEFQQLESSWRSLKLLVDKTDFRENIKINILHATKDELLDDFEFAPEIVQSGFINMFIHQDMDSLVVSQSVQ